MAVISWRTNSVSDRNHPHLSDRRGPWWLSSEIVSVKGFLQGDYKFWSTVVDCIIFTAQFLPQRYSWTKQLNVKKINMDSSIITPYLRFKVTHLTQHVLKTVICQWPFAISCCPIVYLTGGDRTLLCAKRQSARHVLAWERWCSAYGDRKDCLRSLLSLVWMYHLAPIKANLPVYVCGNPNRRTDQS